MTEDGHPNLASALVAALADLTVIEKGNTAKIPTKDGGSFSYSYADIADVVKRTRPVLAQHGVVALTPVHDHGSGLACTVVLLHTGGERMDFGPFPFPHGKDAQATGSMVTYHRRYALVAALGMAAGDDDDGAAAQPRHDVEPQSQVERSVPEGWDDLESWDDAARTYADALASSHVTVRNNFKRAKQERGIGWPVTPQQMNELLMLLDEYRVKLEQEAIDSEARF